MRSDLFALTAAVAGCAAAAPVAQPQWQWGSWGSNGGWGQAPPAGPSGGASGSTGAAAPMVSPPFPSGTGVAAPTGTGVAPIGTGAAGTGVAPVRAAATGTSSQASGSGKTGESTDDDGLNALFVAKGKEYFGTCADPGTLSSSQTSDIIKKDFGQITPENSMKWDATEATKGQFTFDTADQTADFASENGKMLRCHTLVWHSQLPSWVEGITDKTELTEVIENHVTEVAGHFKGKCFAWVSGPVYLAVTL